jgi:hypothetical protein
MLSVHRRRATFGARQGLPPRTQMTLPHGPMTVVSLTVDSFKRLRAAQIHPAPYGVVPVRGRNAQGKSSLIESMLAALQGKKAQPELPITEGSHGAEVVVDLGEIVVRRKWKRDSGGKATSALTIEAADGSKVTSPQAILDNLVGRFADPVAFLEMKPDEQVKTVLGVTGLGGPLERLEAQAAVIFEQRLTVGRDADRLTKAEATLRAEVEALPPPPAGGSLEDLTAALREAQAGNERLRSLAVRQDEVERRGRSLAGRIAALKTELAEVEAAQVRTREEWTLVSADRATAGAIVDVEPIVAQIREHEAASKFAGRRELLAETAAAAAAAREEHRAYDEALANKRADIGILLGQAPMPLPGMAYDPERKVLTINGIPLSGASQAERIKIAAAVAMAGDPPIRVMFAREGSLLDDESRAQLAELAAERGFQLWLEVVDSNPAGAGVWVEDGEATD